MAIDDSMDELRLPARRPSPSGRVRLGTLNTLRWMAVGGQAAAIVIVHFALGYSVPLIPCLAAVAASVALNIGLAILYPNSRRLSERETMFYLAFDQIQLATLLYFTGGLENPFSLLFLAPTTIAATSLDLRNALALGLFTLALVTFIGVYHEPLPWDLSAPFGLPALYLSGIWISLVLGLGFTTTVAFRVASEATRRSAAIAAMEIALEREQRLAAIGSLAAAVAHQLGTPLGTIAVVARELARELPKEGPHAEDVNLLISQVERCREILSELSQHGEEDEHGPQAAAPLPAFLEEIAGYHRGLGVEIAVRHRGEGPLLIRRTAELRHALNNLVENAADFAQTQVTLTALWDQRRAVVRIKDDGPGFAPEVIGRLGEPYITTRPGRDGADEAPQSHEGMGLGFFIAKTLLERGGAEVTFANAPDGGALVTIIWPRARIEADAAIDT